MGQQPPTTIRPPEGEHCDMTDNTTPPWDDLATAIEHAVEDAIQARWPDASVVLDALFDGVAQAMPKPDAILNAIATAVADAMPSSGEIAAAIVAANRPVRRTA
jgi:hypothetical protein